MRGRLLITGSNTRVVETRAIMRGCGATQNAPYCDGSGPCAHEPIQTPSSHGDAE